MNGLDSFDNESGDTVFRDVILLALSGFVAVVLILLPHLHPPVEAKEAPPPGNVVIEINWPSNIDTDVDLWSRRRATGRSDIPTRVAGCSTCCATTSASSATLPT